MQCNPHCCTFRPLPAPAAPRRPVWAPRAATPPTLAAPPSSPCLLAAAGAGFQRPRSPRGWWAGPSFPPSVLPSSLSSRWQLFRWWWCLLRQTVRGSTALAAPVLQRPDPAAPARSAAVGRYGHPAVAAASRAGSRAPVGQASTMGGDSGALAAGSGTPGAGSSASELAAVWGAGNGDEGRRRLWGRRCLATDMLAWLRAAVCGAQNCLIATGAVLDSVC